MTIRVDTHTHTIASDHAYSTLMENAAAAAAQGLEAIGMTDHAPPLSDSPDAMHFMNMQVIDRHIHGVYVMRGAELNICDAKGALFLDESVLENFDYAIASIHPIVYGSSDARENLSAYIGAMDSLHVKIIGHPEDARVPVDFDELARAARDTATMLEVNNSSLRPISFRRNTRENLLKMLDACARHGVPVALGSDAHFATAVGRFDEALSVLREAEFPEELVANTALARLRELLKRKS